MQHYAKSSRRILIFVMPKSPTLFSLIWLAAVCLTDAPALTVDWLPVLA